MRFRNSTIANEGIMPEAKGSETIRRGNFPEIVTSLCVMALWHRLSAFVFVGRRRQLVKVLFADATGICVFAKRLDSGVFSLPTASAP